MLGLPVGPFSDSFFVVLGSLQSYPIPKRKPFFIPRLLGILDNYKMEPPKPYSNH